MKSFRNALIFSALMTMPLAYAQTLKFAGVGATSLITQFLNGALSQAGGVQASNAYRAAAAGRAIDSVSGVNDSGELWIVWNNAQTEYWLYLSVDSIVGVRLFFNNAKLQLIDSNAGTAGIQMVAPASGYTTVPPAIQAKIEADFPKFTAGLTDITAADAKINTARLINLGYGASNKIKGLSSTAGATSESTPVDFNIANRAFETTSIGATPCMVFVNKLDAAVDGNGDTLGGFGTAEASNINRFTLAGFLDGTFRRTRDLVTKSGLADKPAVTFIREGTSGTYTTMEYCIPQSVYTSQENAVNAITKNPLNETLPAYNSNTPAAALTRGGRVRASGSTSLIKWTNLTPNSMGYSFWSNSAFSVANAGNTKYLTVDGVEPLLDVYTGGTYPSGSSVTFKYIRNGAYPIWGVLRALTDPNPSSDLISLFNLVTSGGAGGNFVPKDNLEVFRSHRATKDVPVPHNGYAGGFLEAGADSGGAVYPVNAELDYFADTGMELVNRRLGDTPRRSLN